MDWLIDVFSSPIDRTEPPLPEPDPTASTASIPAPSQT